MTERLLRCSTAATRAPCTRSCVAWSAIPAAARTSCRRRLPSVWRAARGYRRERGSGAGWMFAISRNAAADALRARTPVAVGDLPDQADPGLGPDERTAAGLEAFKVHAAVDSLPGARARGDRVGVLQRPVPERGGRAPVDSRWAPSRRAPAAASRDWPSGLPTNGWCHERRAIHQRDRRPAARGGCASDAARPPARDRSRRGARSRPTWSTSGRPSGPAAGLAGWCWPPPSSPPRPQPRW